MYIQSLGPRGPWKMGSCSVAPPRALRDGHFDHGCLVVLLLFSCSYFGISDADRNQFLQIDRRTLRVYLQ